MLGVTWAEPRAELGGTAEVRTRDRATGVWSGWRELELDIRTPEVGPEAEAGGVRAGTQPLWTGPSDGVQVRVTGQHGKLSRLPDGLRLELVDPDGTGATSSTSYASTAHREHGASARRDPARGPGPISQQQLPTAVPTSATPPGKGRLHGIPGATPHASSNAVPLAACLSIGGGSSVRRGDAGEGPGGLRALGFR